MGATRLASEHFSAVSSRGKKFHLLLSIVCIFPFNYPDARRVAPISACVFFQRVSSNLKCNKNNEIVLENSIRSYGYSVKSKHANKLKHQTQALMGATRLASEHFSAVSSRGKKFHLLLSIVCIFPFNYPDARRVAPISACVFFPARFKQLKMQQKRMPSLPSQHFLCKLSTLCTFVYILIDFQVITQCRQTYHLYALLSALCTFVCTCLHCLHACMHYLHNLITWSAHTLCGQGLTA